MTTRNVFLLLILLCSACTTPEEFMLAGKFDKAISRYTNNLRKTENVQGLEIAYQAAQSRDFAQIDALLAADADAVWVALHASYLNIKKRQYNIAAYMPIRSRDGYSPQFDWLENIDSLEFDAREKAAEQLYTTALIDLEQGRQGNKPAARSAYELLCTVKKNYFPVWRESATLLTEAKHLGTTYVLVDYNSGFAFHSGTFFSDLGLWNSINSQQWVEFDVRPAPGINYQYVAELSIESLDVGFENRIETTREEKKDIETGVKVTYDSSGQVIDRTPIYETVRGTVTETRITKNASVRLSFELYDVVSKNVLDSDIGWAEYNFDETWISTSGDLRALSIIPVSINIGFPGAPTDWAMVSGLADAARSEVLSWFWNVYIPD